MGRIFWLQTQFRVVLIAIVFFCLSISSACSLSQNPSKNTQPDKQTTFEVPDPKVDLRKPLEISTLPKDIALCRMLYQEIEISEFSRARWGLIVIGLNDGRFVCGLDSQKLFNPASIQKLLTSIVALDKLGGGFRTKTSVYAKSKIEGGAVKGDLFLYGRGASDIDDAAIASLVSQLKKKGLKKIEGDVIGDESYFKGDSLGDGWTWNDVQWYYGAAASALSINKNQATISLQNGRPRSDSKFVELSGEVKPIEDIEAIGLKRELGTNKVYVWGNGKALNARIAISKPALLAAKILKEQLEKHGITVSGEVRSVDWKSDNKVDTETAIELASIESKTLAETVRDMNKDSINLYAELILRALGKKFGTEVPDEDPKFQRLRGDDFAGAAVITKWLKENNVATEEIAIHDGSGLSRLDSVTPEAFGRALVFAAQSKFADVFEDSLPLAGRSGTLRGRLRNVSGKVLAKTGSIQYVTSLAGYAKSKSEVYAFAIICNNETGKNGSAPVIDKIVTILTEN